uniref:CSON007677 protein n=1 Tax=Culicoides sonorensis TaxID=179676 RepID=A0A336K077_CULSO
MSSISAQGVVERASAELSKRINGLGLRSKHHHNNSSSGSSPTSGSGKTSVMERVTNVLCGGSSNNHNNINSSDKPSKLTGKQQQQISKITGGGSIIGPSNGPTSLSNLGNNISGVGSNHSTPNLIRKMSNHHHTPQHHHQSPMMAYKQQVYIPPPPVTVEQLFYDDRFLSKFFLYFNPVERRTLAQVCVRWRDLLYRSPRYWTGLLPVIQCREFRQSANQDRVKLYNSLIRRGFHAVSLFGATDEDALDLVHSFPLASKHVHILSLRCASISDRGLEALMDHLQVS